MRSKALSHTAARIRAIAAFLRFGIGSGNVGEMRSFQNCWMSLTKPFDLPRGWRWVSLSVSSFGRADAYCEPEAPSRQLERDDLSFAIPCGGHLALLQIVPSLRVEDYRQYERSALSSSDLYAQGGDQRFLG